MRDTSRRHEQAISGTQYRITWWPFYFLPDITFKMFPSRVFGIDFYFTSHMNMLINVSY